jgi:hypothetical protein
VLVNKSIDKRVVERLETISEARPEPLSEGKQEQLGKALSEIIIEKRGV